MPEAATASPKKVITTTVVTTRGNGAVEDAEPLPFYKRDFWEIIQNLSTDDWHDHLVRVYRADEKWENETAPEGNKFTDRFDEDTIRAKWGGGRYNLWMYGPPQGTKVVRRPYRLSLAGAPKYAHGSNGHGAESEDVGTLRLLVERLLNELSASRGTATTSDAMRGALQLQADALKSGVETVRSLNPAPAVPAAKSALETAMEQCMTVMLTRLMNPQPDPFQAELQKAMLAKLLDPADPIEKFRAIATAMKEFTGASSGKTDIGAIANTFVGALPTLIDKAANGVREYRLAAESTERTFKLQKDHGLDARGVIDVPASTDTTATAAPEAAPPAPAPIGVVVEGPTIQWVQLKIVEIIDKDPEATGEDVYDFLEAVAQELNDQLAGQTAEGLLAIFKSQPILAKVAGHPRLPKILDQYLAYAKEIAKDRPV
jgi:hypothetical protein